MYKSAIVDKIEAYHIGALIKDIGKRVLELRR